MPFYLWTLHLPPLQPPVVVSDLIAFPFIMGSGSGPQNGKVSALFVTVYEIASSWQLEPYAQLPAVP